LPNARRLRPPLHDINDMLMQGWDIRQWIVNAIQDVLYEHGLYNLFDQIIED
jgi:hypothetical protein